MNGAFDISVVIPTRDRWPVLAGTLAALDSQDLAGVRAEVVVADNGSRDPAPDLGAGHPYDLVTVREAVPGAAAARNAGIAAARSDLVLFLGDDCRPAVPGLVRGHVDAHAGGDRLLAIVGGIEWDPAVGVTPLMRWLTETGKLIDMGRLERGEEPGWQAFYTGNLSLRRGALLDVAGFDERFRGYGWEDADLGLRLADAGVRLEHRASLGVLHHHAYGLSDSLRRMEAMGRGANLLERLHDHRRPLPGPAKGRGRAALARAVAPLALRGVLGRRASHLSAYARGHAAAPIDDDPGLRGYGRFAPPGGPRPPVSVVVPFLGSAAEGEELACALEALERRPGDELIVVDNSPAPAFPGAAVRATAQRSSYFARNAGADRARGEWLL
ncbi:MAG: hypothetical protein QOJ07_2329, partial [Thermoleophilaceae bacterium]|nr:hypothetical protein [Thermoleophilaceae bacterium]